MTRARLMRLLAAVGLAVALVGCGGGQQGDLAPRASVAKCYLDTGGARLTLASGCTLRTLSGSTINLASGTTLTGSLVPSGSVRPASGYGGLAVWATSAPLVAVASTTVEPLGLLQPVSMATAGTMPITIPAAGQVICLWNTGTQAISIDDTSTQQLNSGGTPIALGQYDMLCGISDGTRFIQFATSNN